MTLGHFRKIEVVQPQEVETDTRIKIDLDVQNIKQKFLFPFMDCDTNVSNEENLDNENLMSSKIFRFPFESVTVAAAHIKEMMQPIEITVEEVANNLKFVVNNFPLNIVPGNLGAEKAKLLKSTLKQIETENNARLIGIMSHYCY